MGTEIRDYGDDKQVVVWTNEQAVLTRLRNWGKCLRIVWYHQDHKDGMVVVAADLYFSRRHEAILRREFGLPSNKAKRTISPALAEARKRTQFKAAKELVLA